MFIIRSEEEKAVVEQNHFMSKMKALVCQFSTCVDIKHSTCSYKLKSKMYTFFFFFSEISYKASFCSKIGFFYWVTTFLTFIPPLLIAYRSQGKPHFSGRFQIPKKIIKFIFQVFGKKLIRMRSSQIFISSMTSLSYWKPAIQMKPLVGAQCLISTHFWGATEFELL